MTEERSWLEKNVEETCAIVVISCTMMIAMYQTVITGDIKIPGEIIGLNTLILGALFKKVVSN